MKPMPLEAIKLFYCFTTYNICVIKCNNIKPKSYYQGYINSIQNIFVMTYEKTFNGNLSIHFYDFNS